MLRAIFGDLGGLPEKGFYVDVGAFHPMAVSNTALLHAAGWRGINIEPNPVMAARLRKARPDDVTLQQAAGTPRRTADLLFFGRAASSNTLDPEFAEMISAGQGVSVEEMIPTEVVPLAEVFDEHLPPGRVIDFLNVDVEGMDLEALQSNDWERFRPRVVAVEDLDLSLEKPTSSAIYQLLHQNGLRLVSHAVKTSFYVAEP